MVMLTGKLPACAARNCDAFLLNTKEQVNGIETAHATCPVAVPAPILVSYFMILLDSSIICTALPAIHAGPELPELSRGAKWHRLPVFL
jgi:hypothetical protein